MSSPDESTNKPTGDDVFVKPATPDLSTAVSISYDPSTRVSVHVCHVHIYQSFCLSLFTFNSIITTLCIYNFDVKNVIIHFPLSILHIAHSNEYWFHVNV